LRRDQSKTRVERGAEEAPLFALDHSARIGFTKGIKTAAAIVLAAVLTAATSLTTAGAAWTAGWPVQFESPAVTWTSGICEQGFTYKTRYYVIISKSELGEGRLTEITRTAESVRGALASFPLALVPEDTKGAARGRGEWRGLHVIRVYPTHGQYRAAGTPEGSVGFYLPRTGEVAVSLERLIEPKGARSNLEPRQRYRLLVHELVHQAMGERLESLPMWMVEGLAEYFSACQFAPGRYRFDTDTRAIIDHFRAQWIGPGNRKVVLPRVANVRGLNIRSWGADNRTNPGGSYGKYATSLLLVHYQLENARRGNKGFAAFLKLDPSFEAIPRYPGRYREVAPPQTVLWKGRTPPAIERGLTSYWKSKGLDVEFATLPKTAAPVADPFR